MTNEHKELPALAEEFRKAQTGARHLVLQMCCYQDKIYWLLAVDTKGILYTEYDIYRVMEYDLMTDTSKLIVELNKHYISDEAWPEAKTMFVSENHLYINQISAWNTRSLRISLPDGRVEKLVPVSEQTDSVFIPTFLAKNHGTVARNNKEYRYVNIDA
jgi:hypothetical protein